MYLQTIMPRYTPDQVSSRLKMMLDGCGKRLVFKEDVKKLDLAEQAEAQRLGLPEYKLRMNEEMLRAIEQN
jgi:hypothetical protein